MAVPKKRKSRAWKHHSIIIKLKKNNFLKNFNNNRYNPVLNYFNKFIN